MSIIPIACNIFFFVTYRLIILNNLYILKKYFNIIMKNTNYNMQYVNFLYSYFKTKLFIRQKKKELNKLLLKQISTH